MINPNLGRFTPSRVPSRNWLDVLEKNNVRFMALDPHHDQKLINALESRPGWIVEFKCDDAIFYVRKEMA